MEVSNRLLTEVGCLVGEFIHWRAKQWIPGHFLSSHAAWERGYWDDGMTEPLHREHRIPDLASYPGSFSRRKEPGNIGRVEPFTSGVSSFM